VSRYKHHIFVCINERDLSDPKGSCGSRGGHRLVESFKTEIERRGWKTEVRANRSGCLGWCAVGPVVVIYPEGTWYARVHEEDVIEVLDALAAGRVVERLLPERPTSSSR
jgi:(2Fe-2S) ferredoxin